ncbi:MAG: hypothetical protein M3217_05325, partial [Actinomycetota bacterium]|nr:hypothetical protein [Actinomycetota bacterium]
MAIKGKKKSQTRGSQGQRRPAAAPRPVYTGRKHTPWYKKTEGRLIGGMIVAVIVGVSIWAIADAQNRSKERTQPRESLESYVQSVRAFATTIGPVAEEMSLVSAAEPDFKALAEDSAKWTEDLTAAQAQVATLQAPDGAEVANDLFLQSLASYAAAARTFESVGEAEGDLRTELLAQATGEVEQAATLFGLGVDALDEELIEVDGELSNLTVPQGPAPMQPPPGEDPTGQDSQTIEIPPPDGGDGGGGGGAGGGKGKKGGGDQGDGN